MSVHSLVVEPLPELGQHLALRRRVPLGAGHGLAYATNPQPAHSSRGPSPASAPEQRGQDLHPSSVPTSTQ
jgi:hypothetical protein